MQDILPDIQKQSSGFPKIEIEEVGIENFCLPLSIFSQNKTQQVIASVKSFCSLTKDIRGINMSRIGRTFEEVIEREKNFCNLEPFVRALARAHQSDKTSMTAQFDYFLIEKTPQTNLNAPKNIRVAMSSVLEQHAIRNFLTVQSIETSLCPCSKEMSLLKNNLTEQERLEIQTLSKELQEKILLAGFGAHNQKSKISVMVELSDKNFSIEELAELIAKSASAPTFSILKRPDEKFLTEMAFLGGYFDEEKHFVKLDGGPRFVEDIVRYLADECQQLLDKKILDYAISVKNYESIHSGSIVASANISAGRQLNKNFLNF